ncbi:ResB-like family protein [Ancylomarina subtilis]|uniref:ResB-like family protein n=1 Tax=Ancylomarina subtilis TaxID=1639035 RepID=A0A4V2FS78_9BACT|nr:cytochrome c biogenesis protein ResB [Ancylomarina subtilis]RZT93199.1 ResB-like family protein [Ancylomarina subtilis]
MSIKKPIWQQPWGYAESFIISFGVLCIGFGLELVLPVNQSTLIFPFNLILGASFIILLVLAHVLFRKTKIHAFLSGIPLTISLVSVLSFMVIIMGVLPQIPSHQNGFVQQLGLNRMTSSYPFLLINLFLLIVLGLVSLRKTFPFKLKNWGFVCSHWGLWLVIFTGGLGSGDLRRLRMDIYENKTEWRAYDDNGRYFEMPLAIKLKDFLIDEFNPKLAIVENETGELCEAQKPSMIMIEKDLNCRLQDWQVQVEEFYMTSGRAGDRYYPLSDFGAAPAAKVRVVSPQNDTLQGWISCGSFNRPHESLKLNEAFSLVMTVPEPKRFSSEVTFFTPEGKKQDATLEVNKSVTVNGWKVYQLSYDEKKGPYSDKSILEVVRDPWQPYVYLGIFMMMIGAIYMFWKGRESIND